jgi:fumarate hydratase subunit beta
MINLKAPLESACLASLHSGDEALLSGTLWAARDQAHKRLNELIASGACLPFDPVGQIIYYVGPTPAPPGRIIGSAGPTTSGRMDALTIPLLQKGIKALVGKGRRSKAVREAMVTHGAVYLAAVGGAGAFYGGLIKKAETIAWPELGPEALLELTVEDFPVTVINDLSGSDFYENGRMYWSEKLGKLG